ncbi:outer membrane protein [Rhodopseudomonas sp. RCAM05734]|uniref:outer membrane protein n=1 Tax=Rhodopseudomonas sp. RCAM05734 TaxID=3457549 RepID=UPI004044B5BF
MKRILLASAALLGTAVSAQAADMAAKAPYYKAPLVSVYNWTGFYIGVNAGVGTARDRTGHSFTGDSLYQAPNGGFGGGQIGYNWQADSLLGPIVYGIEADIQGAGLSDGYPAVGGGLIGGTLTTYNTKNDWFGTVRGRVGLATGPVLSYFTGGYAYGNVKTTITEGGATAFTNNRTQGGWTVGSGVEAALGGNWTGKIEYLYLNLGNKSDAFAGQVYASEFRESLFRVGLNYRIGGTNAGYTAPVAANWTGWYLGGNVGSGIGRNRSTLAGAPGVESFNLVPDGVVGGVQAGYNWQAGNWVYGIEADIQGSSQKDNKTTVALGGVAYDQKLPWFGTVRGRLGYSVGQTLFYATGGYAYGSVKTKINAGGVQIASFSKTGDGYAVGGGIETPFKLLGLFGPNWTSKTEYLYVDLGSSSNAFVGTVPGVGAAALTSSTSVKEHIFRTGLNYHFNTPVVAKY